MALIDCSACGNKISEMAAACPKCGHPTNGVPHQVAPVGAGAIPSESKKGGHGFLFYVGMTALGLIGAFATYAIVLSNDPETREAGAARNAIALCRKNVADDLLDRNVRLMMRGACEKMESDFQTKFGTSP